MWFRRYYRLRPNVIIGIKKLFGENKTATIVNMQPNVDTDQSLVS
jgi:hypothetical protein